MLYCRFNFCHTDRGTAPNDMFRLLFPLQLSSCCISLACSGQHTSIRPSAGQLKKWKRRIFLGKEFHTEKNWKPSRRAKKQNWCTIYLPLLVLWLSLLILFTANRFSCDCTLNWMIETCVCLTDFTHSPKKCEKFPAFVFGFELDPHHAKATTEEYVEWIRTKALTNQDQDWGMWN